MQPHQRDHRHDIVTAAAAILDNYGIADLTMRRLARELGVSPGALYWHFADKQQLLGAVADRVLQPVSTSADAADWRQLAITVCTQMHDALLSHTDGAELVAASFAAGQSQRVVAILRVLAQAAGLAGLGTEQAALAARSLVYYVLGATIDEQSRLQFDAAGALAHGTAFSPTAVPAADFAFGLRLLIDGVAVHGGVPVS
ncbi:TetR family transcriptional regulator [Mycolicibacter acidiphilus]|uniref:TetR family transcriptional regulator n=1 Tax=Mycolicibacter acidiphilus TaxID=2835306 RepID=UPI0027DC2F0A|nr:TetR family transcriptional regulator [Mycolicibacter acidiphilus]